MGKPRSEFVRVVSWNRLSVVATLLLTFAAIPSPEAVNSAGMVIYVAALLGVVGLGAGIYKQKPRVEIEMPWNRQFDKLRDKSEVMLELIGRWYGAMPAHQQMRQKWEDYLPFLPIPKAGSEPLHKWEQRLAEHASQDVRDFFAFARYLDEKCPGIGAYRRLAMRTYDNFGRSLNDKHFVEWMAGEGVAHGGEEIVVLLAYLEVARACTVKVGREGRKLAGFWKLAEQWHPNTLSLPRHITPILPSPESAP